MKKPISYRAQMKKLIAELRYRQMRYRIDLMALKRSRISIQEIADRMKELQNEQKTR